MTDPQQIIRDLAAASSLRELHDAQEKAVRYLGALDTPDNDIRLLDLDRLYYNYLARSGYRLISDLRGLTAGQLRMIRGIGEKGIRQIQQAIYLHDHPAT
jgi:DNA-directed RNA polymerase alpha subunit